MNVYYSHSALTFGTPEAKASVALLKAAFPGDTVIDPECLKLKEMATRQFNGDWQAMTRYVIGTIVGKTGVLVVEEVGGYVGRGVFSEVTEALAQGIPVLCLRGDEIFQVTRVTVNDENDWRLKYGVLYVDES